MQNLSNNLELLISASGLSESELSRRMNLTTATLNKIKTGIMSNPTLHTLNNIANYFEVSIDQLIGNKPLETYFSKNLHCVPIIKIDEIPHTNIKDLTYITHNNWTRIELGMDIAKHNIFAIVSFGDAMFPLLDKQTIAIVDGDCKPTNKSLVLSYIAQSKEVLIRKILIDGSCTILKPLNNSFPDIKLMPADKILGTVVSTIKEYNKK